MKSAEFLSECGRAKCFFFNAVFDDSCLVAWL